VKTMLNRTSGYAEKSAEHYQENGPTLKMKKEHHSSFSAIEALKKSKSNKIKCQLHFECSDTVQKKKGPGTIVPGSRRMAHY